MGLKIEEVKSLQAMRPHQHSEIEDMGGHQSKPT